MHWCLHRGGGVWADTMEYSQRAGGRHPLGMHSCLFIFQKWKLDRVLNYTGQHLCKSTPLGLPSVYLVPLHPDSESQLEMTVKALVAPGSRKTKSKEPLEVEPLRLVFDPSGVSRNIIYVRVHLHLHEQ